MRTSIKCERFGLVSLSYPPLSETLGQCHPAIGADTRDLSEDKPTTVSYGAVREPLSDEFRSQ
jgi:hypothetical protein